MLLSFIQKITGLSAFRHRNYRLYWLGMLGAVSGWQVVLFANLWLVYHLTGSPLQLGLVGGASAVGNLAFTLYGGVIADRVDRRRVVMATQFGNLLLNLVLGTLTLTGRVEVWHVQAAALAAGALSAFDVPARQALIPHLLGDRKDLTSAIAGTSIIWQSTRILGPVFAAFLINFKGPVLCYYFNVVAYGGMVLAVHYISVLHEAGRSPASVWESIRQGLSYIFSSGVFTTMIGTTLLNSVFGMAYIYLLPAFAEDILKVGTEGYGFIMSASGVGAMVGALSAASLGKFKHKGWLFLAASFLFGVFLILFAWSRIYALTLALAVLAATFNYLYMVTVQTMLQAAISDEVRGRVMGIYALAWSMQPLGSLLAGTVAEFYGVPVAVALGGAVVSGFSLFILLFAPTVRRLRA